MTEQWDPEVNKWKKYAKCSICRRAFVVNNYPDRKVRVNQDKIGGKIVCPWCKDRDGKFIVQLMQQNVEDWRFVWMNEATQYHHFKSLAFLLNHKDKKKKKMYRRLLMKPDDELEAEDKELINSAPALMYSRRWLQKVIAEDAKGRTLGDINYNTYRRIVRRFHTEVMASDMTMLSMIEIHRKFEEMKIEGHFI